MAALVLNFLARGFTMSEVSPQQSIVTFHRIFSDAVPPLRGDKSGLGTLPAAAFQYCEAVRTASSYGWYIFPPTDIRLLWNGVDVMYSLGGDWEQLTSIALSNEFVDDWDDHAPVDLKGYWPPFMTSLFQPGIVQIWSGLLVSTAADWSLLIGPPSNLRLTKSFECFEGMVETDTFRPCPLFINIQLLTTDREILIARSKPLFQVRPVHRSCYANSAMQFTERVGLLPRDGESGGMTAEDWAGYSRTVRKIELPQEEYCPGRYAVSRRRSAKRASGCPAQR
jgi:Family of unknown function (DUF6065)